MTALRPIAEIREEFPALGRRHAGRPVAYFDAPGGTQVPRAVVEAMSAYLLEHNANTHWAYPTSLETDATLAAARETFARFLNASPDEIAFGPNMTTLTFNLARALGRSLRGRKVIVVTELDHHANIDAWRALAQDRGVMLRFVPVLPDSGTLDRDALRTALQPDVALLAIGAASNAIGTVNDVREAAALAHAAGARIFVDAVAFAPHLRIDVRALDCDFLACSPYKFYGPHLGVLYGRRDALEELDVPKLRPAPDGPADRFELGTQSHESIAGAAAAVRFLAGLTDGGTPGEELTAMFAALEAQERALTRRLWSGLREVPGVRLFGPPPDQPRIPTVSFTLGGWTSEAVARALAAEAVFVSHGDFYASTLIERLGAAPDGLVRAGIACYTTEAEIDRLVEGVHRIAARNA